MKRLCAFLLFLSVATPCAWCAAAQPCLGDPASSSRFSVYLIPRMAPTKLYRDWSPFLERLGKETGLCFEVHIPQDFSSFEYALHTGKADFAFLNPYQLVMVARSPGYVPLVRNREADGAGLLVVRKDSPIRDIHQLDGKHIAFPAPNAYFASLLLRATLARERIRITADYVGSHSNVYRAVALGTVEAGGGANTSLMSEPAELQAQLRVLFTTPSYMSHPFAAHSRIPPQVREKFIAGFLKLADDAAGRDMLKAILIAQPVRADYSRDYRPVEKLRLERFVVTGGD